jgi:WD40 repeat protein
VTGARQSDAPNLRVWDLEASSPQESSSELDPGGGVYSLAIDGNSRWLAASGRDETAWLWDLGADTLATSRRVLPPVGDDWGNGRAPIWRIAISPDAKWLFTSRFDYTAQLWDLSEQVPKPCELLGHNGVQSAAISPDGRWLVAGCRSNAHLWDLQADDPTSSVRVLRGHEQPIWSVRISADGRWLLTDSSDATIRRWCLDTEWLLAHARQAAGRELTEKEREYYGIDGIRPEHVADIQQ